MNDLTRIAAQNEALGNMITANRTLMLTGFCVVVALMAAGFVATWFYIEKRTRGESR